MKANLRGAEGIELNTDYLRSVGGLYTYFYVPAHAMSAEVLNAVCADGPITLASKSGDEWQIQVKSEMIKWED